MTKKTEIPLAPMLREMRIGLVMLTKMTETLLARNLAEGNEDICSRKRPEVALLMFTSTTVKPGLKATVLN